MRYFLFSLVFIFSVSVFGQDYDKQWNKVYAFELDGKTKSASEEVEKIYKKAKKDKNDQQIIKSFLYQSKFILSLEENGQQKVIQNLKNEIAISSEPNTSILNYIYAKSLNDYYFKNRYSSIRNRTQTEHKPDDFLEWNESDFISEIEELFKKTLENKLLLFKSNLSEYKEFINFGGLGKNTNRNLYDFFTFEYLSFLQNQYYSYENNISDSLQIKLLSDPETFVKTDFSSLKSNQILSEYQKLEKYYLDEKQWFNLERVWLDRIKFSQKISQDNSLLLKSYQYFADYSRVPYFRYEAILNQAQLYHNLSNKSENIDYYKKALVLVDTLFKARNKSDAYIEAENLRHSIIKKEVNFRLPKNLYSGENSRIHINHRNIDTLFGYVYKMDYKTDFYEKKTDSIVKNFINKKEVIKKIPLFVENKGDYHSYSTEFILPNLEKGQYLFVLGEDLKWKDYKDFGYSYSFLNVTDISLNKTEMRGKNHFRILDRKTGKPLEKATVTYNNATKTTDKFGEVIFDKSKSKESKYFLTEITYKDDYYCEDFHEYGYHYTEDEEYENWEAFSELYTDRAIYRPGQILYYKGIVHQVKKDKKSVVPDIYVELRFKDENHNEIEIRRVKTNEFGSFSGEFTIPKNIITGDLTIEIDEDDDYEEDEHPFWDKVDEFYESSIRVKVEEYKKPTFEVVFDKIEESFVINDTITITGKAKTFSGVMLSDAKVDFIINRNSRYSKNNFHKYIYGNEQIDFGKTTIDKDGNFTIKFKAIPKEDAEKEGLPIFSYSINAIVTDNQGETRSNTTTAKVGFHNLELFLNAPNKVNSKEKLIVDVNSTNLNGAFVELDVELKIFRKENPEKIQLRRIFPTPENQAVSEDEFYKLFPYEPYNNEKREPKEILVYTEKFSTKDKKQIGLNNIKNWISGNYRIEIASTDDLTKEEIQSEKYFNVTNDSDMYAVDKEVLNYELLNKTYQDDGFLRYKISTATNLLYVIVDTYIDEKQIFKKLVEIKNGNATIEVPISGYQGTVSTYFYAQWENNRFLKQDNISIFKKVNSLKTEIVTMNNRLEPNSPQTWSFFVKDEQNKGSVSEVLASMYDMSLDNFTKTDWSENFREPYRYSYVNYFPRYANNVSQTSLNFKTLFKYNNRISKNDSFNWYGYDFVDFSIKKRYYDFLKDKSGTEGNLITGIVLSEDNNLSLPGASIVIKGTTQGTQTDLDGWFEIKADKDDVLVISFVGMKPKEIKPSEINQKNRKILLDSDNLIEEVVIAEGYRAKYVVASPRLIDGDKESYYRGNVYTTSAIAISSDDKVNSILDKLQGVVSGLTIAESSGQPGGGLEIILRGLPGAQSNNEVMYVIDGVPLTENEYRNLNLNDITDVQVLKDAAGTAIYGNRAKNGVVIITTKKGLEELSKVQTRQNLKETAFFYPHLTTDKNGSLSFNFTSPEALTSWKFRMLSHTKSAVSGYFESVVTTQKDLMIEPNMPRFVRETDTIIIKAKVSNLSNEIHNGMAMLQLTNINDNSNIKINDDVKQFKTNPKGSETLSWKVVIPKGTQGLEYKITAKAGNFTDGEQSIIPVLPNRILVNESIPIWVRENSKKDFVFENLKNNDSKTLEHNSFTLEYTSNPTWIAIGSLPYLMEYQHECSEQIFSKLYANSIASHILESNPKIKEVFAKWSENPTSKLEQNEELKNILLSETPWIRNSQSEEEQKKNLALLMDLQKSKSKSEQILKKLEGLQKPNGSFGWFEGSPENTFITTHIATGFGHLKKMGIDIKSDEISKKAINYLDKNFEEKTKSNIQNRMIIRPYNELHYLYARSFYPEITSKDSLKLKIDKAINQHKEKWLTLSLYEKGLLALILHRNSDSKTAKKILEHFKESAVIDTDFGMYWLENVNSPYWYKAPVETQALLIEAFSEISPNDATIEELKVWLIKQKQTKHWSTTKSTTLAVNALLLGKKDFVSLKDKTTFSVGKEKIKSQKLENKESEAGYVKLSWKADEITKDFAEVSIENKSESVGFGGLYWSYFEDLDNIKKSDSNLMKIEKELYLKKTTKEGSELVKITSETKLKLGDLVTIRLVLKVSEEMDFVHLKDMRASGFEPVDVLSKYEYKDGISYYKSTKDVATHFFFDSIDKGTYVLEYDVRVNNLGSFSNGITTLQSMYAPEYSSHTSSVRVNTSKE